MEQSSIPNGSTVAAKMRIDSLVSAESISPVASKSASWRASGDVEQIRPLHILLLEAKRAALEDEVLERRKQELSQREPASSSQLRPAAPANPHLPTSSSSTCAISLPSSTSSTTGALKERIFSRAPQGSVENLSSFILNRTNDKQAVHDVAKVAASQPRRLAPAPAKENTVSDAATATPQPKLLKLSIGMPQRRPLSGLQNLPPINNNPTLTRAQSFPPPATSPARTSTLTVKKRTLEASPTTSASARILAQSLPNVKIHVQKKIKLMPRPAGQVQARPEGVKNVLVYHF